MASGEQILFEIFGRVCPLLLHLMSDRLDPGCFGAVPQWFWSCGVLIVNSCWSHHPSVPQIRQHFGLVCIFPLKSCAGSNAQCSTEEDILKYMWSCRSEQDKATQRHRDIIILRSLTQSFVCGQISPLFNSSNQHLVG